jgi:hypothetical protein
MASPRTTRATAKVQGIAPASVDRTFEIMTPSDPSRFYPKFGVIPATVEVRDQTGGWDAPGQTRQLMLGDGSSVIEHLRVVDRPHTFDYELTDFTKIFGVLVQNAKAEWRFSPADGGTLVHWTYSFFAKPGRGLFVWLIVRLAWAPYMRKVLPGLFDEVRRVTAGS